MTPVQLALSTAQSILAAKSGSPPYTRAQLGDAAAAALDFLKNLSMEGPPVEELISELEQRYTISIGRETVLLGDREHRQWYLGARAEPGQFGERYFRYLAERIGWPHQAVSSLSKTSERITGLLGDPALEGRWSRRGLVVGHVQSGKTANYAAVMCRAADAGYRLIVVLAGIHNALRAQTQMRLDRDFVGFESDPNAAGGRQLIGVGEINRTPNVICPTNRDPLGDFSRQRAESMIQAIPSEPVLLVIKKQFRILANLNDWVTDVLKRRGFTEKVALLVIDDEADQASIDTKAQAQLEEGELDPDHDPTRINGQIRKLLGSFDRSTYLAYTATPFANILIHDEAETEDHGEDLFPRSFIVNLPTPSNYVGPSLLFGSGSDRLSLTRSVDQEGEGWAPAKHKIAHQPTYDGKPGIPPSLEKALLSFILAGAARRARGQLKQHNSMLVHVSRFVPVQQRVYDQIEKWLDDIKQKLSLNVGSSDVWRDLESLWFEDFAPTTQMVAEQVEWSKASTIEWGSVRAAIPDLARDIRLVIVNSESKSPLDYDRYPDGFNVIAIGGDKLSRGLTLEGLTISYFLRPSKMYDSLMQMGRWFGYRPGYLDLCRIHVTDDLRDWFQHVSLAAEDLREQIDLMARQDETPKDYGLRVNSHDVLNVTAYNKRRHSREIEINLSGSAKIPTVLSLRPADLAANLAASLHLMTSLDSRGVTRVSENGDGASTIVWRGAKPGEVASFLKSFRFHEALVGMNGGMLAEYILKLADGGRLVEWTVALPSGRGAPFELSGVGSIRTVERQPIDEGRAFTLSVKTVLNPADEAIDLSDEERAAALLKSNEARKAKELPETKRPDPKWIRFQRPAERGLLLLYAVENPEDRNAVPVFAPVISFPEDPSAPAVAVVANQVYMRGFEV
ncbi:MAG: Z1 domain-containing protein [Hyphomonadaceae bacterium]